VIATARLILRPFEDRDRPAFATINADPEVMDFPGPLDRAASDAEIDDFSRRWRSDGFCFAAIEERDTTALLGMAGIARCDLPLPLGPCVEIGWRLARSAWGHGYASEASRAWLAYGLVTLGLPEIVAFTDPANHRSLAVMTRIGMQRYPERDFEHPAMPVGHPLRAQWLYAARRE
jgi:RimJ/RimL family protein N-acetyltransferase